MLGIIGSLTLVFVNFQWIHIESQMSLYMFAAIFIMLAAGTGLTVAAGLMGAALGGPLPDLVKRMTAVQFLRLFVYMGVPILIGYFTKKDSAGRLLTSNKGMDQEGTQSLHEALIATYHDLFLVSFILSLLLVCLSFFMNATGMGHKLAHKPHGKREKHAKQVFQQVAGFTHHKVIQDKEYRDALKNFNKPCLTKSDT